MRTTVGGHSGSGIPGRLVHRYKVDVALLLHERLRSVAVMYVPIDDQHALQGMPRASVVRRDGNVAKETKPHRAVPQRVMPRWSNRAEGTPRAAVHGHVH